MGTIYASASLAAAASVTTSAFQYDPDNVVTASCVIGATPPDTQPQVRLQLSIDGTNWVDVDRRTFGVAPSQTYYESFSLSDYVGGSSYTNAGPLQGLNSTTAATWLQFRLIFSTGGQAVTVAAVDINRVWIYEMTLTGTTATTGGAVGAWSPPEGGVVAITSVVVLPTANTAGAANLSVGVAANATTNAVNLVNAQALGSAANTAIFSGAGTSATVGAVLTGTQAVTFTASANASGLAGKALIHYVKP